jgi:hypothetical protein
METPNVPMKASSHEAHHVIMLQKPIPETTTKDLIKTIGWGLAIAVGQFALLILLLGWAVHR